jgi:hypothetical protein
MNNYEGFLQSEFVRVALYSRETYTHVAHSSMTKYDVRLIDEAHNTYCILILCMWTSKEFMYRVSTVVLQRSPSSF